VEDILEFVTCRYDKVTAYMCVAVAPVNVSHIFYCQTFCTFTLQQ